MIEAEKAKLERYEAMEKRLEKAIAERKEAISKLKTLGIASRGQAEQECIKALKVNKDILQILEEIYG